MKSKYIVLSGMLFSIFACNPCVAEIYKYKDSKGNWQFSDKPPKDSNTKVHISGNTKKKAPSNSDKTTDSDYNTTDLKSTLYKKYNPGNLIEQASLATVTIQTPLSVGSGFFVSNDGYLLTNKHVIRPSSSGSWQETNTKLNKQKKEFDKNKKILAEEADHLRAMYEDLKTQEIEIDKERRQDTKENLIRRYQNYRDDYLSRKQHYHKIKDKFDKNKRAFDKQRSEFNINSSMANVTKTFKIILKNEKTLSARLVSVSKKHDLALLKLERYITPHITTNKLRVHQTMKVYAVGSPLGIRDSVTSGIITGIKEDYVLTDTKILPGNSGGPLLNKEGAVIGVNTARVAQFVNAEGLGIAIPIAIAHKEFAKYLVK